MCQEWLEGWGRAEGGEKLLGGGMGVHGATGRRCEFRKLRADPRAFRVSYGQGEHLAWIHSLIATGGQVSLLLQDTRSCTQILPIP